MRQSRHPRRRRYGTVPEKHVPYRKMVSIGLLALLAVFAVKTVFSLLGVGNAIRNTATLLEVEDGGVINVSVDGGPLKRAENELKLYAGDTVVSSPRNFATLSMFDDTVIRMDESTQLHIIQSDLGEEKSTLDIELEDGTLWVATPQMRTFSGAITRTIRTAFLSVQIPSSSEIIISPRSLAVFAADGLGLDVTVAGSEQHVTIGEGQQFTIPVGGEKEADLYVHRNPLDPQQLQTAFVETSRARFAGKEAERIPGTVSEESSSTADSVSILTVTEPENDSTVDTSTINVRGKIGKDVEKVRINGYLANIDGGIFSQELALPEDDDVNITIEAVDKAGVVIAESLRTVHRDRKPPEPPVFTGPVASGETYTTTDTKIEIAGTAPKGAVGIIVNDYRLQLFSPGDTTWSYLADINLNNLHAGKNIFTAVAINAGGYRSEEVSITIILGEEPASDATPPVEHVGEGNTNNLPLMPGSIQIYAPAAGTEFTTSETENLIEGNVPNEAKSIWVNGYQLQLFEPSRGFFNYIASTDLNTLKRGRNTYHIVARSESGHIVDSVDYIINFEPAAGN